MAAKPTILVQTFKRVRGRLVPGTQEVAPSESGARKKAEALAGRMPGAAAISITADPETGEVQAATILATFGEIPDDFAESLTAGDAEDEHGSPTARKRATPAAEPVLEGPAGRIEMPRSVVQGAGERPAAVVERSPSPSRRHAVAGLLAAATLGRTPARAQAWPTRPVTLVHGFGAGGNADSIARVMAQALSGPLGTQVIVEAKPGAGGNIASEVVAKGAADGYTLVLLTGGHAVSAALYRQLRFRPIDDFAFASMVATFPFVLATKADGPIGTVADLIEAARREPGKLTFSSVGYGSTQHLAGELFAATAGIKLSHVPYRGGMQPLTDLMSGRIDLMVDTITVTGPAIRSGTVRGLGVSSASPWPALPDVPPIARTLPSYEVRSWIAIAAPAALSPAILAKLNDAIRQALGEAETRERLTTLGVAPEASTPEAARAFVSSEIARWQSVVEKAGIERQ